MLSVPGTTRGWRRLPLGLVDALAPGHCGPATARVLRARPILGGHGTHSRCDPMHIGLRATSTFRASTLRPVGCSESCSPPWTEFSMDARSVAPAISPEYVPAAFSHMNDWDASSDTSGRRERLAPPRLQRTPRESSVALLIPWC